MSPSRPLFQPLSFDRTVWSHPIPLGEFGFIEVNVNASGGLSGSLSGSYGPGFLVFAVLATIALVGISGVRRRWRRIWGELYGAARV